MCYYCFLNWMFLMLWGYLVYIYEVMMFSNYLKSLLEMFVLFESIYVFVFMFNMSWGVFDNLCEVFYVLFFEFIESDGEDSIVIIYLSKWVCNFFFCVFFGNYFVEFIFKISVFFFVKIFLEVCFLFFYFFLFLFMVKSNFKFLDCLIM